jgi:aspartate ammonia-lyase
MHRKYEQVPTARQHRLGLSPRLIHFLSYEQSTAIAKKALATNRSVVDIIQRKGCSTSNGYQM